MSETRTTFTCPYCQEKVRGKRINSSEDVYRLNKHQRQEWGECPGSGATMAGKNAAPLPHGSGVVWFCGQEKL